jgi:hypothetical protein
VEKFLKRARLFISWSVELRTQVYLQIIINLPNILSSLGNQIRRGWNFIEYLPWDELE